MENWGQFLWTVVASSAGSAALLALAGALFKGQIGHWLNKDLEAAKARHQRDLEAYKVGLIAEAERARAQQEIKKAQAMRIVEKQFVALDRLHRAVAGHASIASEFLRNLDDLSDKDVVPVQTAMEEIRRAHLEAGVFLSPEESGLVLTLDEAFEDVIAARFKLREPQIHEALRMLEAHLFKAQSAVNEMVGRQVRAMMEMGELVQREVPTANTGT